MSAAIGRLEALLRERRAEAERQLASLADAMGGIRRSRVDSPADDEHDPEGPTISAEWSRISGLQRQLEEELSALDRALERMRAGAYGTCSRCGRPISPARLEARPAADLCIDCARLAG